MDPILGDGTLTNVSFNALTGSASATVATGNAAVPAAAGILSSPIVWILVLVGVVLYARS